MATSSSNSAGGAVRVLAVTCSRHRPLMLRHCILQMRRQSYPVDHAIYINSDESDDANGTSLRYDRLVEDAAGAAGRLMVGYGPTLSLHRNFLATLELVELDAYDLFLKVDDDDIYFRAYAAGVVADFLERGWDCSGTHSHGVLNGSYWNPGNAMEGLQLDEEDIALGVPQFMPSTMAFSREAIRTIQTLRDLGGPEDALWRRGIARSPHLNMALRHDANFAYNVHGGNFSTAAALAK